jgi:hypothetical protein
MHLAKVLDVDTAGSQGMIQTVVTLPDVSVVLNSVNYVTLISGIKYIQ